MLTDEMKTKWTDALESGEYEQGRFHLKMDGKYCCLGVFCEVNDIPLYYNDEIINKGIDAGYSAINLYIDGSVVTKLMAMNDGQEKTFPEIATWIKENL